MKLIIKEQIYKMLKAYSLESMKRKTELQGWGSVEYKDDNFIVKQLFPLPKQKGGMTTTSTIADKEILKWMKYANFHWHTHPGMSVFFSSTDVSDIEKLVENMEFLVSIVLNEKMEVKGRVDAYATLPFGRVRYTEELHIDIEEELPDVSEEVSNKLVVEAPKWSYYDYEDYNSWYKVPSKLFTGYSGNKKKTPF